MTWEMDLRIMQKRAHEKGKKEGVALGKKEGIDLGKREVAEALRKKGMSEAEIAEVTGLPEKGNVEVTVCFWLLRYFVCKSNVSCARQFDDII